MTAMTSTSPDDRVELLLAHRAGELARPDDDGHDTDPVDVLVVTLGGQPVALPVDVLREVRPPTPIAPVPGDGAVVVGVAGGHGEPLVLASLRTLLGQGPGPAPTEQWVVVLDHPGEPVGLLVDSADDIVTLDRRDLRVPPRTSALVAAVTDDGALLLDTSALLADPRLRLAPRPEPTEMTSWHGE